jgi:hypothetical protein
MSGYTGTSTRNLVIFLAALLLAVPWIPVLLIAAIFTLTMLGFWFGEIARFIERQEALRHQAKREEADQRVRQAKLQVAQGVVLLVGAVPIGIALCIGALGHPEVLKLAAVAGFAWASIATALSRRKGKRR